MAQLRSVFAHVAYALCCWSLVYNPGALQRLPGLWLLNSRHGRSDAAQPFNPALHLPQTRSDAWQLGHLTCLLEASAVTESQASAQAAELLHLVPRPQQGSTPTNATPTATITQQQLQQMAKLLAAADASRAGASAIGVLLGTLTLVNMLWLVAIAGLCVTAGPALHFLLAPLLRRLFVLLESLLIAAAKAAKWLAKQLQPFYPLLASTLCFYITAAASSYPPQQGAYIALTGHGLAVVAAILVVRCEEDAVGAHDRGRGSCWEDSAQLRRRVAQEAFKALRGALSGEGVPPAAVQPSAYAAGSLKALQPAEGRLSRVATAAHSVAMLAGVLLLEPVFRVGCFAAVTMASTAVLLQSQLAGFLAVVGLFLALGFVVVPFGCGWGVGWYDSFSMAQCEVTASLLLLGLLACRMAGLQHQLLAPFQLGVSVMGGNCLFLAGLIHCSWWHGLSEDRSVKVFYTVNGLFLLGLVCCIICSSLMHLAALRNTAITYLLLFLSQKTVEISIERGAVWLALFILSAGLWQASLFLASNPQWLASLLRL